MHTASDIVKSIRATDADGKPVLTDSEAELMVKLFASVQVVAAQRSNVLPFPSTAAVGS